MLGCSAYGQISRNSPPTGTWTNVNNSGVGNIVTEGWLQFKETGSGVRLRTGAIPDGYLLQRSGTNLIGVSAGALSDGNKGDIIVSGSGTNWIRTDSILRYGAIPNDGLSDTAAIRAAILATTNATLYFPPGEWLLTDIGGDELLLIEHAVNLQGAGSKNTRLVVSSSVGASVDVIRYHPPVGVAMSHLFMRGIEIVAESGTPGRDGIVIDTTDQGMAYTYFEDVNVLTQLGGYGFRLVNPTLTDGWFISALRDCRFAGGVFLQRAGDNIIIENCNMYGNGWGFDASFVAGASSTLLLNNNLTSKAGQIRIGGGTDVNLIGNNCEWPQSGTTAGAGDPLVQINGAGDQVITLSMIGNTLAASGVADTDGIETTYVKPGSVFIGNQITVSGTGTKIQEAYAHYFDHETGGIGFGTTTPAAFGDYAFQWNTNGPMKTVFRNINTNASASSDIGLNAWGGTWWLSMGSTAKDTNGLSLKLDSAEHMRLSSFGNLGIGTAIADNFGKFVVQKDTSGPARAWIKNDNQTSSASTELILNAWGNQWGFYMGSTSNNNNALSFRLDPYGTPAPKMTLTTDGFLGIGTTNPVGILHIGSTSPVTVASSGFVGIGTTNPISLLHLSAIEPTYHMQANGVGNFRTIYGSDGIVRLTLDSAANTNILTIADNGNVGVGVTPDANARLQTSSFSAPQIDQAPLIVTIANGETLTLDNTTNKVRAKVTGAAWTILVPASAPSTNHEGFWIEVTNTVATVASFNKLLYRQAITNDVDSVTNSLATANFWMRILPSNDGTLVFNQIIVTDDDFSRSSGSSSGGISGLTTGTLPYADSATTLADSPMTRDDAYTVRAANINATTNIRTASIISTNGVLSGSDMFTYFDVSVFTTSAGALNSDLTKRGSALFASGGLALSSANRIAWTSGNGSSSDGATFGSRTGGFSSPSAGVISADTTADGNGLATLQAGALSASTLGTFGSMTVGTNITITAPLGFVGNLADFKVDSVTKFNVTETGRMDVQGGARIEGNTRFADGAEFYWTTRSILSSPANGQLRLANNAATETALFGLSSGDLSITPSGGDVNLAALVKHNGLKRCNTLYTATDTTLGNVTDLTVTVAASTKYFFRAQLNCTLDATDSGKYAIGGTATATSINYRVRRLGASLAVTSSTLQTSLGSAVNAVATITDDDVVIEGDIVVNAGGTLTVQFAKVTDASADSTVAAGSKFEVWIPTN